MQAAIFHGAKQPLELSEVDRPRLERDDEVLVKVVACGLCHTDLSYIDHGVPTFKKPPLILGHEPSGIVEEIGPAVKEVEPGDRVLIGPITCGRCFFCKSGRENICSTMMMIGNNLDGAYAQYVKVPARALIKLPPELPLAESCIISDAVMSPFHSVRHRTNVQLGDWVVVFGCGGVGLNCVQWATLAGGLVIAVDVMDSKLQLARELGAVETFNSREVPKVAKEIHRLTGLGADISFECIGNPEVIAQAFDAVRPGGQVCVVGFSFQPATLNAARLMYKEIEVKGSVAVTIPDYYRALNLIKQGRFKLDRLISARYPLAQINQALDQLRQGEAIRIILEM